MRRSSDMEEAATDAYLAGGDGDVRRSFLLCFLPLFFSIPVLIHLSLSVLVLVLFSFLREGE